jgi:hypothetical protein
VGLSLNPGRIIVIEPRSYPSDMCVQEKYVLAHTNNTDLILNSSHQGIKLMNGQRYFQIISRNQLHENYERFLDDDNDNIKPLSAKFKDDSKESKELVFI